LESVF